MAVTRTETIRDEAVRLLKEEPNGLRYSELQRRIIAAFPEVPPNTIHGATWNLDVTREGTVHKPTRGLFKFGAASETGTGSEEEVQPTVESVREEDFYAPFAEWLKTELGECTDAVALGGSCLGKKWGTPDVIGVYKPSKRDIIQFQPEVISAEIKTNPADPITAFGQAIAYRLFSSKVYLVEPSTMAPEDQDRIEALCILFGVGLILFAPNRDNPDFTIRVRAQRYIPDMFYVNDFADKLYAINKRFFDRLF